MPTSLLDFFFPKRSLTGVEGEWITTEEREKLVCHPVTLTRRSLATQNVEWLDRLMAASTYASAPLLRKAIQTFKYQRIGELQEDLGRLLCQISYLGWTSVPPILCPVPLHWSRERERGFNQSALLAEIVARERKCVIRHLLTRQRPTGHQAWRERGERFDAVRDAFRVVATPVPPYVVLIDDISTTGATLDMCAKALKKAGAKRVEALVLALG